jgi:thiamine pyrophosphokinase
MDPVGFLENRAGPRPRALVVLNGPITDFGILTKAWEVCDIKVFADGGANRVYDFFTAESSRSGQKFNVNNFLPDYITGDFDSLRDDVKQYYEQKGVKIVHDPDQYSTDFMKAVKLIENSNPVQYEILAFGSLGGRVDQEFHSIHFLYLAFERKQTVILVSEESITFLLDKGTTTIRTPQSILGDTCGIIPVGVEAVISTKGLRWDVSDWPTKFGGQMSTSNQLVSDVIEITTNEKVVFTVELRTTGV